MIPRMQEFLIIDDNLRTAMRFFGNATGTGEIASLPGALAIYSGLDYGVFNIAMLDGPVIGSNESFGTRLAALAQYFKRRTSRWSLWLCEDLIDPSERRRARQTIAETGLRAISHPPGMTARQLLPPTGQLPEIEVLPVAGKTLQQAFGEITALAFDIPFGIAQSVYAVDRAWHGDYRGYVGLVKGKPVAIVATVVASGAIGVYSLATDPAYRRRGYAEAVMRSAVETVRQRTGIDKVVLQSTEAGYPLYRRMGFRDVTRFTVYLTK